MKRRRGMRRKKKNRKRFGPYYYVNYEDVKRKRGARKNEDN